MNNARRKELQQAIDKLDEIREVVESLRDEEEEAFDNIPENMQDSEKGEKMQDCIGSLENCISNIEEAISDIEEAIG